MRRESTRLFSAGKLCMSRLRNQKLEMYQQLDFMIHNCNRRHFWANLLAGLPKIWLAS